MIGIEKYSHFGGKHIESANLKNLLAHHGVKNPHTDKPFSEALCFGIAGGIGIGYSFCPSVVRHRISSGISIVGRHCIYATGPTWYQGFCDRLGIQTRVTETSAKGKAYKNLLAELEDEKPAIVWCGSTDLPFLGRPLESCGLYMHTFIVHGVDDNQGIAFGADRAPISVEITLKDLEEARNRVCSHKNRTMSIAPPEAISTATLKDAVEQGIQAALDEMMHKPKMKTFSLPGLEIWAKMICNDKNKEGWGKAFPDGFLYSAFREVYKTIESVGTGGGLYRLMYADFLNEAADITGRSALKEMSDLYRDIGKEWAKLADAALPKSLPIFKETKDLLKKQRKSFESKKDPNQQEFLDTIQQLHAIENKERTTHEVTVENTQALRERLRERIIQLHQRETDAAIQLTEVIQS